MENFRSCNWYSDENIPRYNNEERCYPHNLISSRKYKEKIRMAYNDLNNCHVKHAVQSEYMIRMSPIDKLIAENKKKMSNCSLVVCNANFLKEKANRSARNKEVNQAEQRLNNLSDTPEIDKSLRNLISNEPSRLTRSTSKRTPDKVSKEECKNKKKLSIQSSDFEIDFSNDGVDKTYCDISLNMLSKDFEANDFHKNDSNHVDFDSTKQDSSSETLNNSTDSSEVHNRLNNTQTSNENLLSKIDNDFCERPSPVKSPDKTLPVLRLVTPKLLVKSSAYLTLSENKLSKLETPCDVKYLNDSETLIDSVPKKYIDETYLNRKLKNESTASRQEEQLNFDVKSLIDSESNIKHNKTNVSQILQNESSITTEAEKLNETKVPINLASNNNINEINLGQILKKHSSISKQSTTTPELDRNAIRRKATYLSALDLVPADKIQNINNSNENRLSPNKCSIQTKAPIATVDDKFEEDSSRSSSDNLRRSFLLEYSSDKNDNPKHTAVPILIPERTSGSSFHPGRTCMHKCSYCHGKFGLLDTPCHIAQIKSSEKQIACLENVTHLIGPDSCLCDTCFRTIEKRSGKKSIQQSGCIVVGCVRQASNNFKSQWIEKVKKLLGRIGIVFQDWQQKTELPICSVHHDDVMNVSQCQLCGNRALLKFELIRDERQRFQQILDEDQIAFKLHQDLFICKPCRVYLIWRTTKNIDTDDRPDFIVLRDTVIKRICMRNGYKFPSYVKDDKPLPSKRIRARKIAMNRAAESVSKQPPIENKNDVNNCKEIPAVPLISSKSKSINDNQNPKKPIATHVAYIDEDTYELFNELQKPYGNSIDLVNHLIAVEKAKIDGHLVLADNNEKEMQTDGLKKQEENDNESIVTVYPTNKEQSKVNYGKRKNDNSDTNTHYCSLNDVKMVSNPKVSKLIAVDGINAKELEICDQDEQEISRTLHFSKYVELPKNDDENPLNVSGGSKDLVTEEVLANKINHLAKTNNDIGKTNNFKPMIINHLKSTGASSNIVKRLPDSNHSLVVSDKIPLTKTIPVNSNVKLSIMKPNNDQVSGTQKMFRIINKSLTSDEIRTTITSSTPSMKMEQNKKS
ncbi:uncharacterized protein LOC126844626 [Adelges cooleyi]|uniref:uncharacterized protein LOC126844626 n=1 Tax=Adelges cooleyi TaxID=133065 RepID=UPI00217FEA75|nr:uncharacterized protein LOC126844626 [Adelges cooleyi]XP_050438897.1 uncharacterized protein LOC126844626 [Adelges cooleyi]XP_050438898.1 uncharacterized protein LOC126844626 [Adelges cooleyi]